MNQITWVNHRLHMLVEQSHPVPGVPPTELQFLQGRHLRGAEETIAPPKAGRYGGSGKVVAPGQSGYMFTCNYVTNMRALKYMLQ